MTGQTGYVTFHAGACFPWFDRLDKLSQASQVSQI
jgi:hypothetical protein